MSNKTKARIVWCVAMLSCVGAPLAATLSQFPIWIAASNKATMSGVFLVFAIFSCLPFIKQVKAYMKSPASWLMWCVITAFLILLNNIINEMIFVGLIGAVSNVAGTLLFKLSNHYKNKDNVGGDINGKT